MKNVELKQLNYDELLGLIESANLLLESKKQEKERNEIKRTIMNLVRTFFEKGGDRKELLGILTPSTTKETITNSEIEGLGDVVLIDKEHFSMGRDKTSDYKIEDALGKGVVNQILQEGNVEAGRKNFPDPEISRVVNPRGILPCLVTGGSCLVDVKELEGGTSHTTDIEDDVTVKSSGKKGGRTGVPILQFSLDKVFVKEWESTSKAETSLGMSHQSIGKAVRGRNGHKAGGFLWYGKDDPEVMEDEAA